MAATGILLTSYTDESGIHAGSPVCILAGYLASPRQWQSFERAWSKQLPSGIDAFHAKDFFDRDEPFDRMNDDEATNLLDGLLRVIKEHRIQPYGVAIDTADFNSLEYVERQYLTGAELGRETISGGKPSSPYMVGMIHCLVEVSSLAKDDKRVFFVFDRQKQYEGYACYLFDRAKLAIKDSMPNRASKLEDRVFRSRKEAIPLQAADLLVHCLFSHVTRRENIEPEKKRALDVCAKGGIQLRKWAAGENGFDLLLGPPGSERRANIRTLRTRTPKN
ncbi:MAG TPA: DUF3800 domain-containing protein [Thermoanaerobaculia bacterium]|nr:DUF3800 domain-containing protein [Thermoanaerobaculia bacterium]